MKFKDTTYFQILKDEMGGLKNGLADLAPHFEQARRLIESIPEDKAGFAYGPGKWTVSQVLGHMLDARMVFLGRALFIARGDRVALPPFDEHVWARNSGYDKLGIRDLAPAFESGSSLILTMLRSVPEGALENEGIANSYEIRADEVLLYLMTHESHHLRILRERYL